MDGIDYVVLFVGDLDASIRFYREVLGLPFSERMETYAEFRLSNLKLGLLDRREVPDLLGRESERGGGSEIVLLVRDVDAEADRLRGLGATLVAGPRDRPWGHRTLHLADPDGHVVELAQEIPRSS
ncbi:MAG: VOC family protein [Actinomycetota bacterium]